MLDSGGSDIRVSLLGPLALGKLGFLPDVTRGFVNLQKQHAGPD